jgi:hypothetical protein
MDHSSSLALPSPAGVQHTDKEAVHANVDAFQTPREPCLRAVAG